MSCYQQVPMTKGAVKQGAPTGCHSTWQREQQNVGLCSTEWLSEFITIEEGSLFVWLGLGGGLVHCTGCFSLLLHWTIWVVVVLAQGLWVPYFLHPHHCALAHLNTQSPCFGDWVEKNKGNRPVTTTFIDLASHTPAAPFQASCHTKVPNTTKTSG